MEAKTTIYIVRKTTNFIVATVKTKNLAFFSRFARHQLNRGGTNDGNLRVGSVTIPERLVPGGAVEEKALAKVLRWIGSNDTASPKPFNFEEAGISEFPELIYAYKASYTLMCDRGIRGDGIRNQIVEYIRAAPLRFDEFAMVFEQCEFDTSLKFTVKNNTMRFKLEGGVPEMAKIEEYAAEHGFLEELGRIERAITGKSTK